MYLRLILFASLVGCLSCSSPRQDAEDLAKKHPKYVSAFRATFPSAGLKIWWNDHRQVLQVYYVSDDHVAVIERWQKDPDKEELRLLEKIEPATESDLASLQSPGSRPIFIPRSRDPYIREEIFVPGWNVTDCQLDSLKILNMRKVGAYDGKDTYLCLATSDHGSMEGTRILGTLIVSDGSCSWHSFRREPAYGDGELGVLFSRTQAQELAFCMHDVRGKELYYFLEVFVRQLDTPPNPKTISLLDTSLGHKALRLYFDPAHKEVIHPELRDSAAARGLSFIPLVAVFDQCTTAVGWHSGIEAELFPIRTLEKGQVRKNRVLWLPEQRIVLFALSWEVGWPGIAALRITEEGCPEWLRRCKPGPSLSPSVVRAESADCLYDAADRRLYCPWVRSTHYGKLFPVAFSGGCLAVEDFLDLQLEPEPRTDEDYLAIFRALEARRSTGKDSQD